MREPKKNSKEKKTYLKPEITRVELVPEQAVLGSACHSDASCDGLFAFPFSGIDPLSFDGQ